MIVDAFLYFNEKELAELRIKYLDKIVDFFVVVESNITHQGKSKSWNFEKLLESDLRDYKHKIKYYKLQLDVNNLPNQDSWIVAGVKGGVSWKIENIQRNYIQEAFKNFSSEDIIIISDVDEIPSKTIIQFIKNCDFNKIAPIALEQFLFHLNCNFVKVESWRGSIISTVEICKRHTMQHLRNNRNKISHFIRSGWSFSSFGGVEKVREKFEAFAHKEYNNENYKSVDHIKKCIETGSDLFNRNVRSQRVDKNFFPKDLLLLMEENAKFFFGDKV